MRTVVIARAQARAHARSGNDRTLADVLAAQEDLREALAGDYPPAIAEARRKLADAYEARAEHLRPAPDRLWGEVRS